MLRNSEIKLRAVEPSDAEIMLNWRFAPENYDYFYEYSPVGVEMQRAWMASIAQRNDQVNFIAETVLEKKAFGMVSLTDIDLRNRKAELARVLIGDDTFRGTGKGRMMVELCLEYAFGHLNLHKVYLEVFADNSRAVSFYKGMGFEQDGVFKEHIFKSGSYKDVIHMSLKG